MPSAPVFSVATCGLAKFQFALLNQDHGSGRGDRLGHRIEAKNRVSRHRGHGGGIAGTKALIINGFAMVLDQHDGAGEMALPDLAVEHLGDAIEAGLRKTCEIRGFGEQIAGRRGRADQLCGDSDDRQPFARLTQDCLWFASRGLESNTEIFQRLVKIDRIRDFVFFTPIAVFLAATRRQGGDSPEMPPPRRFRLSSS